MSAAPDAFAEFLPPRVLDMALVIPLASAIKLCEHWPGVPLHFPAEPGPDHPISLVIGWEQAKLICQVYAGTNPVMPRLNRYYQARRDQFIIDALENKTMSGSELALQFGLRSDRVYEIYAQYRKAQQGDLFQQGDSQ